MSDALTVDELLAKARYSGRVTVCPPCTFTEAAPAKPSISWLFARRPGRRGGRTASPHRDKIIRTMAREGAALGEISAATGYAKTSVSKAIRRLDLLEEWRAAKAAA